MYVKPSTLCTIVDDALNGYELRVLYDGHKFVVDVTRQDSPIIRAIYRNGRWTETYYAGGSHPMRRLLERINSHILRYTHSELGLPGEMPGVPLISEMGVVSL